MSRANLINMMRERNGLRGLARAGVAKVKTIQPVVAYTMPQPAFNAAAAKRFVEWVQATYPKLYAAAQVRVSGRTLSGLGADTTASSSSSAWQTVLNTITNLAPSYLQYQQQQKLFDLNLARLQQGLTPVNASDFAPAVQVSLDPTQTAAAASAAWDSAKPWVIGGGLLVLGMMLFGGSRRGRG